MCWQQFAVAHSVLEREFQFAARAKAASALIVAAILLEPVRIKLADLTLFSKVECHTSAIAVDVQAVLQFLIVAARGNSASVR